MEGFVDLAQCQLPEVKVNIDLTGENPSQTKVTGSRPLLQGRPGSERSARWGPPGRDVTKGGCMRGQKNHVYVHGRNKLH